MFEIERIMPNFEQLSVKFKGDGNWYYMKPDKLKGVKLKGSIVKKRVRTWFE